MKKKTLFLPCFQYFIVPFMVILLHVGQAIAYESWGNKNYSSDKSYQEEKESHASKWKDKGLYWKSEKEELRLIKDRPVNLDTIKKATDHREVEFLLEAGAFALVNGLETICAFEAEQDPCSYSPYRSYYYSSSTATSYTSSENTDIDPLLLFSQYGAIVKPDDMEIFGAAIAAGLEVISRTATAEEVKIIGNYLRHSSKAAKRIAVAVLLQVVTNGHDVRETSPDVIKLLREPELEDGAAALLGRIGEPAVPFLMKAWADEKNYRIRERTFHILMEVAPKPLITVFCKVLDDTELEIEKKEFAITKLGEIGPHAYEAIPRLISFLDIMRRTVWQEVSDPNLRSGILGIALVPPIQMYPYGQQGGMYEFNYHRTIVVPNPFFDLWSGRRYRVSDLGGGKYSVSMEVEENPALEALHKITGRYFGDEKQKWQDWWEENKDKLEDKVKSNGINVP